MNSDFKNQKPSGQQRLKTMRSFTKRVENREGQDLVYDKIKDSRFKQQTLPAWRPVPTILTAVIVFIAFGVIFILLGIILLYYSKKVHSIEKYYEGCGELNSYCDIAINVDEDIDQPIFVYYQLDGFYQNARRYLQSKSLDQLKGNAANADDCEPAKRNSQMNLATNMSIDGTPLDPTATAIPCGLVARSFFNDTFNFTIDNESIIVDDSDIAFAKDRDLYSKNSYKDKQWQDLTDQHFLVWMRPSGLPNPKKLWGKIERDLKKGETINVTIANNYNVSAYKGKKKIILSNATSFGGKNTFLGVCYIVVGILGLISAAIFGFGARFQREKEKNL